MKYIVLLLIGLTACTQSNQPTRPHVYKSTYLTRDIDPETGVTCYSLDGNGTFCFTKEQLKGNK